MKRMRFTLCALAVSALSLLCASAAQAQSYRTWVSGVGDDSNTCSRTAPCKTFSGALAKTLEGGEISVLDHGSYGAVHTVKGVTINGEGALAAITVPSGNGITVNANPSTATVTLRNLHINGLGTGSYAIRYLAGKALVVDNCRIQGFFVGVYSVLTTTGRLKVVDTAIENSTYGIFMSTSAGQVLATIERTRIIGNLDGDGIYAFDHVRAQISHCVLTHNLVGIITAGGDDSILNVDDVHVAHSFLAGLAGLGTNSEIRVSDSMIVHNNTGVEGNVHSFQGNSLANNVTNGSFASTTLTQ